ncbi:hypothetical protein [Candidatus Pelagibacter sp.]|uniref:hypothetical protein n=1 Tax=Candidatus Pelagibacter sp. TaxID=2024849 RepID=UPI003F8583A4
MIPKSVSEHLEEYICQEVYVQIAVIKGKDKGTTKAAINKYFSSNHFRDLSEGRPFDHFIDGLKDKCLGKLINSPMRNTKSEDEVILELQNKLNTLDEAKLNDTYWEIETGEYLSGAQVKELENQRDEMIKNLDLSKDQKKSDTVYETIISFCKKYEDLCKVKYPEAPLPLEISKNLI